MRASRHSTRDRGEIPGESGFTLVEALVAAALTAMLAIGVWIQMASVLRWTRKELQVLEAQQAGRIALHEMARRVRMAGRGGLGAGTVGPVSESPALTVRSNVGEDGSTREIAPGFPRSPRAAAGSDILIVRGVFESPVFVADPEVGLLLDATGGTGRVRVRARVPLGGPDQDLSRLRQAVDPVRGRREALVLVSAKNDRVVGVAMLDPGRSLASADFVDLRFDIGGSELAESFARLSSGGSFPSSLRQVAWVGILEEYRYYVRVEEGDDPTDGRGSWKLSRARLYPGTNLPYAGAGGNLRVDVAHGVMDLQVALGFDSPLAGGAMDEDPDHEGLDDRIVERPTGEEDDWLFNGAGDDASAFPWSSGSVEVRPRIYYCRISVLVAGDGAVPGYSSPRIDTLEDRRYSTREDDPIDGPTGRRMVKWLHRSTVVPRNLH